MPDISIQVKEKRFYLIKWNLKSFCKKVIQAGWQSKNEPAEVSVVLTNDHLVQQLNKYYRKQDRPTNVLTFASETKPKKTEIWLAGDIVIAYETLCKEAKEQHKSASAHLAHLLTHGVFHLQGYDHQTPSQARTMEHHEIDTLRTLGFDNPYQEK